MQTTNNAPIDVEAMDALEKVVRSLSAQTVRDSVIEALIHARCWNECFNISVFDVLGRLVALNLAADASHDVCVETDIDGWAAEGYAGFMAKARVREHLHRSSATNSDQHDEDS